MYVYNSKMLLLISALSCLPATASFAACNCESSDAANPCTGQSISVTVNATTINGANSANSTFAWVFNSNGGDARCGQFANGDYWIAPASGQSTVTITGVTTTSPGTISADADPVMESMGLLSGTKNYGNYNSAENIIPNLPISYSTTTSLVAAIQRNEATEGNCGTAGIVGECVDAYDVVTVLPSVPENAGSTVIRPNITGASKVMLSLSDFDFTKIPTYSFLTGTNSAGYEAMRQRWSHSTDIFALNSYTGGTWKSYSEGGRAFRSHILIDDYAAGVANQLHSDIANVLSASGTLADKQAAIAAILSYGLDMYYSFFHTSGNAVRKWGSGAGQHLGKFTPAVFMAAIEKTGVYANDLKTISTLDYDIQPQELAQVHIGIYGPVWGDFSEGIRRYWNDMVWSNCYDNAPGPCNPNVGSKTEADPYMYIDGPANQPGSSYFGIGYAGILNFSAIMALMPSFATVVNTTKPIDFVVRARSHGLKTWPDTCVTTDDREDRTDCNVYTGGLACDYYYLSPIATEKTWGPKSITDATQGCVTTEVAGHTQQGRFRSMDGTPAPINLGYATGQLYNNWDTIIGIWGMPGGNLQPPKLFKLSTF